MMQHLHERAVLSWSGMVSDSDLGSDTTWWSRHAIRTSMLMAAASLSRRPASNIFMFLFPSDQGSQPLPRTTVSMRVVCGGKVPEKQRIRLLKVRPLLFGFFCVLFFHFFFFSLFFHIFFFFLLFFFCF